MIKIVIGMFLMISAVITYSLCVAAKKGDKRLEECKYNILVACEGKCCRYCDLENMCKLACRDNPKQCGGRINY